MPFKSEKQRRFLWAEHPDIAKRWAHEYPNQKKLPLYAHKNKKDEPVETNNKQSAVNSVALDIYAKFLKKSGVTEVRVAMPQGEKPTYAGQEQTEVKKTKQDSCGCGNMPKTGVNSLMAKLSAVLSQSIQQALENEKAEQEARDAAMVPANAGIKRYAMPAMGTPLPMGMQSQAPQAPQQAASPATPAPTGAEGQLPPVGGGNSANANPINAFGGLSTTGDINGNAALGTANSAGGEKLAGTPAWQRSAGKNDEGGLNAKGRASYNKATGGHLKAPVTESNPKGDRAKRQNSFCSRMCGMKRVNTGADTKKDPDSRINKSLRKWNCKCSSAYEFGKEAGLNFGGLGRLFGGGAKAVANTAAKAVAPKLNIANVHPSVAGPLAAARGESLMRHPDIMENVHNYLMRANKRPAQAPTARMRMPGAAPGGFPRFGDTQQAQQALADASARFERVMAGMGRRNMSNTITGDKIRTNLTAWGGPTTDARTWGQLQGIVPAAQR
jgi:hypothetical protein